MCELVRIRVAGREDSLSVVWYSDSDSIALVIPAGRGPRELGGLLSKLLDVMLLPARFEYIQHGESSGLAKNMSMSKLLWLLNYIGESIVYPYSFQARLFSAVKGEEARTQVLAVFHRVLKTPELFYTPLSTSRCIIENETNATGDYATAFLLAGLLTGLTRRAYEILITIAQTLLAYYHLYRLGGAQDAAERSLNAYAVLASYLYTVYAWRLQRYREASEVLRHLAVRLELKRLETSTAEQVCHLYTGAYHCLLNELRCAVQDSSNVGSLVDKVYSTTMRVMQGIHCELSREYIIGRLRLLKQEGDSIDLGSPGSKSILVTVATGQWSLLQALLLSERMNAEKLHVIYTQESMWNRFFEEFARTMLKSAGKSIPVSIKYWFGSSTDALHTRSIVSHVINRALRDAKKSGGVSKVIVLAQGPAGLAVPLYAYAERMADKGVRALLI